MSNPPPLGRTLPLVPPLYQSSVYTFPDLDVLDRVLNGEEEGFIYARDSHPNARHLAAELAALENAEWALVGSSGMASISTIVLALVGGKGCAGVLKRQHDGAVIAALLERTRPSVDDIVVIVGEAVVRTAIAVDRERPECRGLARSEH